MTNTRLRLGQLLVDARMVTPDVVDEVLSVQQSEDTRRLGTLLVERGLINETQLTQILSHQLSVPWVSLLHIEFSRQLLNLVPRDVAERFCLVPIYVRHVRGVGQTLYVAMDDPTNQAALSECQAFSGLPVRAMIAPPTDILNAIRVYYGGGKPRPAPAADAPPPSRPSRPMGEAPRARRSDRPPRGRMPSSPGISVGIPAAPRAPAEAMVDRFEAQAEAPFHETPAAPELAQRYASTPPVPEEPGERDGEAPSIEVTELGAARSSQAPDEEEAPADIPKPRGGRAPRMVSLTLLDGTTITLPARKRRRPSSDERQAEDARASRPDDDAGLTARDLVAALRAVSHGADATEILGSNVRWEAMFSALLSVLLKKYLIADWEFVEEFKKI
jgi:type IV pilus assembly protein PilB